VGKKTVKPLMSSQTEAFKGSDSRSGVRATERPAADKRENRVMTGGGRRFLGKKDRCQASLTGTANSPRASVLLQGNRGKSKHRKGKAEQPAFIQKGKDTTITSWGRDLRTKKVACPRFGLRRNRIGS